MILFLQIFSGIMPRTHPGIPDGNSGICLTVAVGALAELFQAGFFFSRYLFLEEYPIFGEISNGI